LEFFLPQHFFICYNLPMTDETTTPNNPAPTEPAQPETAQTVPAENNPTPQVPPPAPEPSAPATTDTAPVEMPSEAPEAPKATPVIESPIIPVNTEVTTGAEPEKTPENIVISEPQPETAPAEGNEAIPAPEPVPATPIPPAPETPKAEPVKEEPKEEIKEIIPEVAVPATGLALKLLIKAREAIQFRRRKKLDRLMTLFLKKPQITNDDVEKLLHVSDATATRYLSILEKEGKIKQSGKTGARVTYSRV
jgi:hypothetical protein